MDLAATFAGFVVLWLALDRSAAALGSLRGEFGIPICLAVVALAVIVEFAIAHRPPRATLHALGLRPPRQHALIATLLVCAALLCFYPLFSIATGARIALRLDALALAVGILAQGGIAEEIVFRGFLFRRLRETRTFWRAALIAAIPFVAVHALLFLTLEPVAAAVALVVSLSVSFPLAWLFEQSGNSIWPPAIVHAVIQGSIKVIEVGEDHFPVLALCWMALSIAAPWALLLLRR